jgi:hypothetical protein
MLRIPVNERDNYKLLEQHYSFQLEQLKEARQGAVDTHRGQLKASVVGYAQIDMPEKFYEGIDGSARIAREATQKCEAFLSNIKDCQELSLAHGRAGCASRALALVASHSALQGKIVPA